MAYSSGGLIEATDYNGFAASVNAIWGAGSGNVGMGQSDTVSTVAASNTVTATQWATLIARIDALRQHQSGTTSGLSSPTTGDTITYLNTLSSQISTITTNMGDRNVGTSSIASSSASGTWGGTVSATRECSLTFASANQMRLFFNTGGTVTFNAVNSSFSGNAKSDNWDVIANNAPTQTVNYDNFYTLTTSYTTLVSYAGTTTGGYDYNSNVLYLAAKLNAAPGSSTVITLRGFFEDGSSDTIFNDTVSGTARIDANANAPATTYIANVWGAVSGTNNVTVTQS
jgi:hypothetical protein